MPKILCKQPIETARLRIRKFSQSDVEPFITFMTDRESTRFLIFGDEQKSHEGAKALIEATIGSSLCFERELTLALCWTDKGD